jgi:AraC-like DNA-binding protein
MAPYGKLALKRSTATGTDPDELAELLSTPASPITIQPLDRRLEYSCNFVGLGPLSFTLCSYEGDLRCERQAESDKILVFLPSSGTAIIDDNKTEVISTQGRGTIMDGKIHGGVNIFGPRQHLTMIIDRPELVRRLSEILERPVRGGLDFHPDIDLTQGPGLMLKTLAETAFAGLTSDEVFSKSPLALASLSETINNLLLESFSQRFQSELTQPAPTATPRHVDWAIDYMLAHLCEVITIEDIAAAAKVSIRTLQQSFRQYRMTTPMSYLQELRMAQARRELLEPRPGFSVSEVARKWGFAHLGRFAQDYKRKFGESPSETLRK